MPSESPKHENLSPTTTDPETFKHDDHLVNVPPSPATAHSPATNQDSDEEIEEEEDEDSVDKKPASTPKKKKKKSVFHRKGKVDPDEEAKKQQRASQKEADAIVKLSTEDAFEKYGSSEGGISSGEASTRLNKYGRNALEDKRKNPVLKFLSYFVNPLAFAMEVAALISLLTTDYLDFGLIIGLLFVNATIGFWEEASAGNAIAALKAQLALKANVRRDGGGWQEIDAETLVPGDIIQLSSGQVCGADCKIISTSPLKVDQSALTGESLPVTKHSGDPIYSGSTIRQGDGEGLVYATGKNTYFGRSAALVSSTDTEGHYKVLLSVFGWFCSSFIILFVVLEIIVQFVIRGKRCGTFWKPNYCPTINNLVVLIAGGVPIAMPTVLSVTMAIGAAALAKQKAIVSRLTAVEDLASMDVLCTDKTGTLTKNKLEMGEPFVVGKEGAHQLVLDAALASDFSSKAQDPIDKAIINYLNDSDLISQHEIIDFTPFDPVSKRTMSKVKGPDGKVFIVAKGAPQVILDKATNRAEIEEQVEAKIEEFAKRGFRSLGVARKAGDASDESWEMEGLIPLFDPPRDDTRDTIQKAIALGVTVKMLTGDQTAIAIETAKRLGMGTKIMNAKQFTDDEEMETEEEFSEEIQLYDGFSQVRPEHKFEIVKLLQERGHIVAMTGDGVNDAPALKKANIGFAVADATEAARSASDIVMTEPGLSVMVSAIIGSRKIFERMKDYSTYTISVTVRIVLTFSILTFAYDWYFPTVLVLIIAILNDGTIMTISRDRVQPAPLPDKWNFRELFIMAALLGFYQVISSIVFFTIIKETSFFTRDIGLHSLSDDQLRAVIYLQVSISGQATIFVTRTRRWFFLDRPAYLVLGAFVVAQIGATLIGVYGLHGYPHDGVSDVLGAGWAWALATWIWVIVWHFPMDLIKFFANGVIFKSNIPFVHPYSAEDKARDMELERKSKAALEERKRKGLKSIEDDDSTQNQEEEGEEPSDEAGEHEMTSIDETEKTPQKSDPALETTPNTPAVSFNRIPLSGSTGIPKQ